MNNTNTLLVVSLIFLALAGSSHAQDQALVSFPTGNAAWTVDIKPSSSQPPTPPPATGAAPQVVPPKFARVIHAEVNQVNGTKRIRLTWSDGKTTEKWNVPGLQVTFNQDPRTGTVRPRMNGSMVGLTYDSVAFAWLSPSFLKEKDPVDYEGKECFHYVGVTAPEAGESPMAPSLKREAWIEAKTLLPVAMIAQDATSTFTFANKPPTEALTPPPAFAQEIAYYEAVMGGLPSTPAH